MPSDNHIHMVKINNSELTKEFIEATKAQTNGFGANIPNETAEKIIPVMEVNPKLLKSANIVRNNSALNASSGTLYTTPTDKDFYLTGASLCYVKDVTSTSTSVSLRVTIDGAVQRVFDLCGISLTAGNQFISLSFDTPIKIDKNTAITINSDTAVANIIYRGTIIGYTTEIN